MIEPKNHPGVLIPPPLFYVAIWWIGWWLERLWHNDASWLYSGWVQPAGWLMIAISLSLLLPAVIRFLRTRNPLPTIMPSKSLETSGIFSFSRNPMYTGLAFGYVGISLLLQHWGPLLLMPLVIVVMTTYVIAREEEYLDRAFGHDYLAYKARVRRWL